MSLSLPTTHAGVDTIEQEALRLLNPSTPAAPLDAALAKKAERIGTLIQAHFDNSHRKAIAHLMSAVLECPLAAFRVTPEAFEFFPEGMAIVPLQETGHHRPGRLAIVRGHNREAITRVMVGEPGCNGSGPLIRSLADLDKTEVRPATAEEITKEMAAWRLILPESSLAQQIATLGVV